MWLDREARELFLTALLMAEPYELLNETPQLKVNALEPTGFVVPPGWYGLVRAAGPGIIRRAGIDSAMGLLALERLGDPDVGSRTSLYEGRRLVRIDGGYLALNFAKYREKDHTAAERSKRYRENLKEREAARAKEYKKRRKTSLHEASCLGATDALRDGLNESKIQMGQPEA